MLINVQEQIQTGKWLKLDLKLVHKGWTSRRHLDILLEGYLVILCF